MYVHGGVDYCSLETSVVFNVSEVVAMVCFQYPYLVLPRTSFSTLMFILL